MATATVAAIVVGTVEGGTGRVFHPPKSRVVYTRGSGALGVVAGLGGCRGRGRCLGKAGTEVTVMVVAVRAAVAVVVEAMVAAVASVALVVLTAEVTAVAAVAAVAAAVGGSRVDL